MIRVFLGYDPREAEAYHVASHSILTRSSAPVSIAPVSLRQLGSRLHRERDPNQATDFSFSRFLVPSLCEFEGWAIFMDCDVLVLSDIADLWSLRDDRYAVSVVNTIIALPNPGNFSVRSRPGIRKRTGAVSC